MSSPVNPFLLYLRKYWLNPFIVTVFMIKILLSLSLTFCFTLLSMDEISSGCTERDYTKIIPTEDDCRIRKPTVKELKQNTLFTKMPVAGWKVFTASETRDTKAGPKEFTTKIYFQSDDTYLRINAPQDEDMVEGFSRNKQQPSLFFSTTIAQKLAFVLIGGLFLYFLKKMVDNQHDEF